MLRLFIFILIFISSISFAIANEKFEGLTFKTVEYQIRLNNGDIISGKIIETTEDEKEGDGIIVKTALGEAVIYTSQIIEILPKKEAYKHFHRVYLMPTAMPVKDFFVSNYELLFWYTGFSIADIASFTFGRTTLPTLPSSKQLTVGNAKLSIFKEDLGSMAKSVSFAIGANLAFAQHNNRMIHGYAVTSVEFENTVLSAMVFNKFGSKDMYFVYSNTDEHFFFYNDGAFGLSFGLDHKLKIWNDTHFILEVWNQNVDFPTSTAVFLGFRLFNTEISADFGMAFFTDPYFIPIVSFAWTPFN